MNLYDLEGAVIGGGGKGANKKSYQDHKSTKTFTIVGCHLLECTSSINYVVCYDFISQ